MVHSRWNWYNYLLAVTRGYRLRFVHKSVGTREVRQTRFIIFAKFSVAFALYKPVHYIDYYKMYYYVLLYNVSF